MAARKGVGRAGEELGTVLAERERDELGVVGSSREDERDDHAEDGDREQAAKAREGRVDPGCQTRVALRRGRERGGSDRCDDRREPQAAENESRQKTIPETAVVDTKPQQHACSHDQRPDDEERSRSKLVGQPAEASSKEKHGGGRGQKKETRLKGGVADDRLQEQNEVEGRAGDGAVVEEGGNVDEREVAATKKGEGEKRLTRPALAHEEGAKTRTGEQKRPGHVGNPLLAARHEPVGERPNPECDEPCPEHIELRARCLAAGDPSVRDPGEGDRDDRQRDVQEEDPPPRGPLNQRSAEWRAA